METMETFSVLPKDDIVRIISQLDQQKDRAAVDLVSRRYHEILRSTTADFARQCNDLFFKITKVRFLVRKNDSGLSQPDQTNSRLIRACKILCGKYPTLTVRLFIGKNVFDEKVIECKILPVSENDEFICYENTDFVIPAWCGRYISCIVSIPEYLPATKKISYHKVMESTNIAPDDLCYQWFQTGKQYAAKNEITIGSVGSYIGCCCTIFPLAEPEQSAKKINQ